MGVLEQRSEGMAWKRNGVREGDDACGRHAGDGDLVCGKGIVEVCGRGVW